LSPAHELIGRLHLSKDALAIARKPRGFGVRCGVWCEC
jgi:hypothetical protein